MPHDNAAIVRRAFDSFNRRDLAAAVAAFEADGEWVPYLAALEEHIYRGRDRIAAMWREVLTGFPDFRLELVDVVDNRNEAIVVEALCQGCECRHRASSAQLGVRRDFRCSSSIAAQSREYPRRSTMRQTTRATTESGDTPTRAKRRNLT